ncbi:MAG: VOC family protein [Pseudomonadales bacterium]|jgi:glyoxylase I family protein|nr:VOC family protein [Pseudomonadales bacterium]MDG1441392.1 VOC family protein [Pseudomonadales bacterium]
MNITGMVHININCSDYKTSKAFYEMLGFEEFWQVPETNTAEVAAAVGMRPYKVQGALFTLKGANPPMVIDLLQWKDPSDSAPPYPHLYHTGLARIALMSSDLDADLLFLELAGVEIVGPPGTVTMENGHGSRFFCFKDPDGTYLELVENF